MSPPVARLREAQDERRCYEAPLAYFFSFLSFSLARSHRISKSAR